MLRDTHVGERERMVASGRQTDVVRVRITEAGQRTRCHALVNSVVNKVRQTGLGYA
jgi:hypothetical protein